MPFDANGNYTLPTIYIAIPGEVIKHTQHNAPFEDVQAALNNTLCRDGRTPWTGNQNANNNKLTGLAKGTNSTDAVRMDQAATLDGETDFTGKVTVQDVADFTSQEAIPAKQADGRYVLNKNPNAASDTAITALTKTPSTGAIWAIAADGNSTQLQPVGDYATNPALSAEASNRASADTNLQNQVNNRVLKTGDTMTGSLNMQQAYVIGRGIWGGNLGTNGNMPWATQFISKYNDDYKGQSLFCHRTLVGNFEYASIQVTAADGSFHELQFRSDNRLYTASGNVFALTSQLPFTDQNLRWFVVRELVTKDGSGHSTHTFPVAFAARTQPFVLPVGSREDNTTYSSLPIISLDSNGNPLISNTGMTLYWSTGSGNSITRAWLTYLVGGYF